MSVPLVRDRNVLNATIAAQNIVKRFHRDLNFAAEGLRGRHAERVGAQRGCVLL